MSKKILDKFGHYNRKLLDIFGHYGKNNSFRETKSGKNGKLSGNYFVSLETILFL